MSPLVEAHRREFGFIHYPLEPRANALGTADPAIWIQEYEIKLAVQCAVQFTEVPHTLSERTAHRGDHQPVERAVSPIALEPLIWSSTQPR